MCVQECQEKSENNRKEETGLVNPLATVRLEQVGVEATLPQ